MSRIVIIVFAVVAWAGIFARQASADTITFGTTGGWTISYAESGFELVSSRPYLDGQNSGLIREVRGGSEDAYAFFYNTDYLFGVEDPQYFTLRRADGGAFDFTSIGIGLLTPYDPGLVLDAAGHDSVTLSNDGTHELAFTGVTSVTLRIDDPFPPLRSVYFDNLVVNPVPEPTSLALLALGLGMVGAARLRGRRRR